ncbi:MAG: beta-xylosidase [Actinobacteria bacterium]|nr:beta-xylosidase [Actinomycetota bacterium]
MGLSSASVLWESDADLNRDFDMVEFSGAKWVRIDADWNSIENSPGAWNWSYTDRVVFAARARGLNVLLAPTYSPPWARRASCASSMYCPPANNNWFGNFVHATVSRYAPIGIHDYEIWNEPNWDPWWASGPNAADYVALLKPAYLEAHAADPWAHVITGGLAPHGDLGADPGDPRNPVNFLAAMYNAGAQGFFDAVGNHPYPPLPDGPWTGSITWNALLQTSWEHDIMSAHGDGWKHIWGTEYGAPTGSSDPKRVSEADQANYIDEGVRWWVGQSYTGPLFIHTVRDQTPSAPNDWSAYMGLLRGDFSTKPAYARLTWLLH